MNEQIRLLAEQAGIKLPDDAEYNGHIYRNSIEKFARLIVRECLMLCDVESTQTSLEYDQGIIFTTNRIQTNIMKHFGVEETITKGETK